MTDRQLSIPEALQGALEHHQRGDLPQAEAIYRKVLEIDPANPQALHLLGVVAHQAGKDDIAAALITRALAGNPDIPDFHCNLGNALRGLGRLGEAVSSYREALRLSPGLFEAHNNLGLTLRDLGRADEAVLCYRQALRLEPDRPEVHLNLGLLLQEQGRLDEAIACCWEALRLRPDYPQAHNNLGSAFKDKGDRNEAVACYQEALRLDPGFAEARSNLGIILREEGHFEEAVACYREALRLNPAMAEAYMNLGAMLQEQGLMEDAAGQYRSAIALKPDLIEARWGLCISQIPILYDRPEDIAASRTRYREELQNLVNNLTLDNQRTINAAARAAGGVQPFFLAYQGEADRDLQTRYGDLVCRIQSAKYPQWTQSPPMPPRTAGEPIRVGIVSGYFCYHSNWKIPVRGWVENLDRQRFALYGYYSGRKSDAETEAARRAFLRFVEGSRTFEELCREILKDKLHVLIYPEVGMDPTTLRLAALRLSPVQCTSWGHPDTSGLPSMDYYLSSELMEPPGAESHYSERLVRLPNLSIHYTPLDIPAAPVDRAAFGLRPGATVYFCAQSLFKYLPQHDDLFPRIALAAGDCQFVFLGFAKSREINRRFLDRLSRAFARYGLNSEKYVALLAQQDPPRYKALNMAADVFLDSIGWSGCNSTLEAIACNLPVVTLPGDLMRGRHSTAILTMMGAAETVAQSLEDYVRIAARLGQDAQWRGEMSEKIAQRKHRLYRDTACIEGLAAFLEAVAPAASSL